LSVGGQKTTLGASILLRGVTTALAGLVSIAAPSVIGWATMHYGLQTPYPAKSSTT
jgi:hypothetical protein